MTEDELQAIEGHIKERYLGWSHALAAEKAIDDCAALLAEVRRLQVQNAAQRAHLEAIRDYLAAVGTDAERLAGMWSQAIAGLTLPASAGGASGIAAVASPEAPGFMKAPSVNGNSAMGARKLSVCGIL